MTDNRPYTLDELRALPEGEQVWAREHPNSDYESQWHTVYLGCDGDARMRDEMGETYSIEPNMTRYWDPSVTPQYWPAPPSVEDACKWPWPEEASDGQ